MNTKAFFPCVGGSNLILGTGVVTKYLSTDWVDYVEEPMKYQVFLPHFVSVGGWLEGSWGGWWCGGGEWVLRWEVGWWCSGVCGGGWWWGSGDGVDG